MATQRIEIGWSGKTVMHNLPRYRGQRRMTLTDLSAKLTELGRPMSVPTLSAVENGKRRIDVDDLVHLALALDVTPAALLMPAAELPGERLDSAPGHPFDAADWWNWLRSERPLWEEPESDPHELETWRRSVSPSWSRKAAPDG